MKVERSRTLAMFAAMVLVGIAGCGSDDNGVSTGRADETGSSVEATTAETSPPITGSYTTEIVIPPSTEPDTTEPVTTDVVLPPITEPATTTPTTTVAAHVPGGWKAEDTFPVEVFPPFDESNWVGVPSPALPTAPGLALADGIYSIDPAEPWSAAEPNTLQVAVSRLEACTVIPDSCINYGDPYGPQEMGVDRSVTYELTVPLTDAIGVGLTGYDCVPFDARGNGADLAALFTAFDAAYNATITPLLSGNVDPVEVLTASPAGGFTGENPDCSYGLLYNAGSGAPPLLLQATYNQTFDSNGNSVGRTPLTVTDEMHLNTIVVKDGVMTMYLYAGFFS